MKFGSRLCFQQIARWADEYIDYDSLKEQLKSGITNSQPTQNGTLDFLQQELGRVEAFLEQQSSALQQALDEVVQQATIFKADPPSLFAVRQSLSELFDATEDLDSFARTNIEIASRIRSKLGVKNAKIETWDSFVSAPTLYKRPWLNNISVCNETFKTLTEKSHNSPEVDPKTLLFQAVSNLDTNGTFLVSDERDRLPLHYAAAYGFRDSCVLILERAEQCANCLRPDNFGDTPLALAVAAGHTAVVELLLSKLREPSNISLLSEGLIGRMLCLAIQADQIDVSKSLIKAGHELDFSSKGNLTPLYLAAQRRQPEVVRLLVQSSVDINVRSSARSWTPLIVASVYGYQDVVKELLEVGADTTGADHRGWTADDHAAYRGYPKIVQELQNARSYSNETYTKQPIAPVVDGSGSATHPVTTIRGSNEENGEPLLNTDFSHIFVNVGSFDLYKTTQPIDLETYTNALSPARLPKTCMTLEVSASDCEEKHSISLPILEDLSNSPWKFSTRNPETTRLTFKILRTTGKQKIFICTGIALLSELASGLGPHRATVGQDYTIPLISLAGDYMGTLNFTFIVSRPITRPPVSVQRQEMYLSGSTRVGAHRGLGQNTKKHENLQIGENTMQSFESAMQLGASFIEAIDVQVTKDFVPTIYHDFLVSETGTDATMHTLSYAQFMALSQAQTPKPEEPRAARFPWDERDRPHATQRRRSRSLCASHDHKTTALRERMGQTFEYLNYGSKPNIRGPHIHEPFVTLRQLLETLPESVGFDIELKYPMLFETDDWKMDPYAMEHNKFADTILDVLFRYGRGRHIFLTSFSPELCILLATKQRVYPVLFLNDSSNWPTGDPRALSVQSAVHFARAWGLKGIVMASEPFVSCPRLVKYVKDRGLFCASYGGQNDDPDCAKIQADAGINAVIVNKVHLIAKTLLGGK
ncbi:Glycerophosphoryl diester phosphodiesterase family-domain-containing protein [Nemania sp. FL0031]|nr:Glycerophosphoryl diester phosphodiesterase family-domain-containing protein [Nemania sp. FL0031]